MNINYWEIMVLTETPRGNLPSPDSKGVGSRKDRFVEFMSKPNRFRGAAEAITGIVIGSLPMENKALYFIKGTIGLGLFIAGIFDPIISTIAKEIKEEKQIS